MPHVRKQLTLEDVKAAQPETVWYSVNTCWWTHRQTDLRTEPKHNLPCDPRGGMLMMGSAADFLAAAEANPAHYGFHGLDAFMAAHNDNCVMSFVDTRNTCLQSWREYNEILTDLELEALQLPEGVTIQDIETHVRVEVMTGQPRDMPLGARLTVEEGRNVIRAARLLRARMGLLE